MNPNKRLRLAEEKFQAADIANKLGHYQQVFENSLAAAELFKGLTGQERNYASCLNNAANAVSDLGRYAEAQKLFEKIIPLQEKSLGSEHPDTLSSLNNLATVYQDQGDYDKARELHEKVLVLREKVLGLQHPDVAASLNNLATVYAILGKTQKAQDYFQRAQAIITQTFDENHPTVQGISQNYLKLQQKIAELERSEIEQRIALEEAKKLSYLSFMATGIAHNINNPVGMIRLAAQRGLRKLNTGLEADTGQEIFERILRQADRLHEIISGFRAFANGDRQQRETVELNPLVEQIEEYFKNQLEAHHIALKLELSAQNPRSHANRFVLQEVLMDLIKNAREALEQTTDAFIQIETWQTAEKVGFYIYDNGLGIPLEQQKNLFSPFHSTKARGTGLGLYFAHKALAELRGTIVYQDRQPNGAHFTIELCPVQEN